jgi:two-component system response regulator YesN
MRDLPTLDELASLSGISRTYFSYLFKEVMGTKLQRYLAEARLNKARDLLSHIDLKIKEIAFEAGFSDPNYFCRTFKKKTGLSPTNWRVRKILSLKTNDLRKRGSFDRA